MNRNLTYTLILIALVFSSCATVFHKNMQTVHINSNPPGATIEVNGIEKGTTPADVTLKKGFQGETVTLKKTGYENKVFQPSTKFDNIGILNIFIPIGFGVDALTGAMMQYDPISYDIPLTKK